MERLGYLRLRSGLQSRYTRFGSVRVLPVFDLILIVVLALDLLTPYLVWRGALPGSTLWITQALTAVVVAFAYARIMVINRVPAAIWAIVGISAIGITVALARDQAVVATLWGWWRLFKFPLVGLYAYLRQGWSERFPRLLTNVCVTILAFEVVFQVGQYLSGQTPGDNLAGTFGGHGVGPLFFFTVFTLCLTLGQWLAYRQWKPLVVVLFLGIVANVLAENKLFPLAALLLVMLAAGFLIVQRRRLWSLAVLVVLLAAAVSIFSIGYNAFVQRNSMHPFEQFVLDEETRTYYLNKVHRSSTAERQSYNLGRNLAAEYALSSISGDPVTLLFGFGLGARGESESLGTTGALLREDLFSRGSDLVVMVQEMGLLGMVMTGGFMLWIIVALFRDIRRYPQSPAAGLRYALLLFSLLWPLWLWYKRPLGARVTMLLYWMALGYVMAEPHHHDLDAGGHSGLSVPDLQSETHNG